MVVVGRARLDERSTRRRAGMVRQLEVERSGVLCAATASASDNGEVVGSAAEPDVAAAAAAAADVGATEVNASVAEGSNGAEATNTANGEVLDAEAVAGEVIEEDAAAAAATNGAEDEMDEDGEPLSLSAALAGLAAREDATALSTDLAALSEASLQLETRAREAEAASLEVNLSLSNAKESYLRLNADFDNFRKRTIREKEELATKGRGDVLEELLPLVDNFEMAAKSLKIETEGEEKINDAYQGLYKQMIDIMRKAGLSVVDGVGEPFNPEVHDAIMREPSSEFQEGVVMEEFRRGFKFGDRLLRPAMVKVAVAMEESAEEEDAGDSSDDAAADASSTEEAKDSTPEDDSSASDAAAEDGDGSEATDGEES